MLYVKCMRHLYNDNVARYMFMDGSPKRTPEISDIDSRSCYMTYKSTVSNLFLYMRNILNKRTDNPIPQEAKLTIMLNKTPTGEYKLVYSNILASVQVGITDMITVLISASIINDQIFDPSLIPNDVASFVDLHNPVQEVLFEYIQYINGPNMPVQFVEQAPVGYSSVDYPALEIVENPYVEDIIIHHNIPDWNNQHPDINEPNIHWGKVVMGIGLIVGGIVCVATGCSLPSFDVTSIFKGGGEYKK